METNWKVLSVPYTIFIKGYLLIKGMKINFFLFKNHFTIVTEKTSEKNVRYTRSKCCFAHFLTARNSTKWRDHVRPYSSSLPNMISIFLHDITSNYNKSFTVGMSMHPQPSLLSVMTQNARSETKSCQEYVS